MSDFELGWAGALIGNRFDASCSAWLVRLLEPYLLCNDSWALTLT